MLKSIVQELEMRKDFLNEIPVKTIYFGGGTPSLLTTEEINFIFKAIFSSFSIQPSAEITLEANPDDLTKSKIQELKSTPVNRLSIGVQSFFDDDLRIMNRAHTAGEAKHCIENAKEAGFENITIDLIYGTPFTDMEKWKSTVEQAIELDIPHLSCYCLTLEPKTAFSYFVKTGKMPIPDDELAANQFEFLMERLDDAGYIHYEISNFSKPGWHSRHNTAYWQGQPYLGLGPSAHSFLGHQRFWNVSNNAQYVKTIQSGELPIFSEELSVVDQYNEYVMTSLRTIWGCSLESVRKFGEKFYDFLLATVDPFVVNGIVIRKGDILLLSKKGKLLADYVESKLFWTD